jgi:hypothetical protein
MLFAISRFWSTGFLNAAQVPPLARVSAPWGRVGVDTNVTSPCASARSRGDLT